MSRMKWIILPIILLICNITVNAQAANVTSKDLIEKFNQYNNQTVVYKGEVVGDIMRRGDYAWINVSDGNNSIGVWLPYHNAEKISFTGDYANKGDIVEITGTYNKACKDHGGDLDIHSDLITVVERGHKIEREINYSTTLICLLLFIISLAFTIFWYKKGY